MLGNLRGKSGWVPPRHLVDLSPPCHQQQEGQFPSMEKGGKGGRASSDDAQTDPGSCSHRGDPRRSRVTRSCLLGQPRVRGRAGTAVMGGTLIDTCHLMGVLMHPPDPMECVPRDTEEHPEPHPGCHPSLGCHLGQGGDTKQPGREGGTAPGQGLDFTNSSNIPGRRLRVMHGVGNVSHYDSESFVTQ